MIKDHDMILVMFSKIYVILEVCLIVHSMNLYMRRSGLEGDKLGLNDRSLVYDAVEVLYVCAKLIQVLFGCDP